MGKALKFQNLRGLRRDATQLPEGHRKLEIETAILPPFGLFDEGAEAVTAGDTAGKRTSQRGLGHSGSLRKGNAPEERFHANGSLLAWGSFLVSH